MAKITGVKGQVPLMGVQDKASKPPQHPAKFSKQILAVLIDILMNYLDEYEPGMSIRVLDPFAGVGTIHSLRAIDKRIITIGVEIEPEWADQAPLCPDCGGQGWWAEQHGPGDFEQVQCPCEGRSLTIVGNALALPMEWTNCFDMVITSPTYGNRMADHHNARDGSKRLTYTHQLGRPLSETNSGRMHWGQDYKDFHVRAWSEVDRVLKPPKDRTMVPVTIPITAATSSPFKPGGVGKMIVPGHAGGLAVINVSNFIRKSEEVDVCGWHLEQFFNMGYGLLRDYEIKTNRMKFGANSGSRVAHEHVFVLRKQRPV